MSFGNILGQILQDGLGGQTAGRLQNSLRDLGQRGQGGQGAGGIEGILGQLQSALGQARQPGGIGDRARDFMTKDQVGGLSGGQLGGIGALAGALLGGGVGGAARGGALAVLGTLALTALRNAQAQRGAASAGEIDLDPADVAAVTGPGTEKLLLRAMISAAKADGNIDQAEMQKIIGKIGEDGVTDEEKAFVMSELSAQTDVAALAAEATSPALAAEVYAASLLAISVDTDAEREYLRALAQALRLDAATVDQLHQITGAPAA